MVRPLNLTFRVFIQEIQITVLNMSSVQTDVADIIWKENSFRQKPGEGVVSCVLYSSRTKTDEQMISKH